MGKTPISWTQSDDGRKGAVWNFTKGCQRTAPEGSKQSGCGDASGGGCYAERTAARFCGPGQAYEGLVKLTKNGPRWSGKVLLAENHLLDPIRWTKPSRIFTDSMSDLFYKGFGDDVVDRVLAVMMICSLRTKGANHVFQTLTKRADRMHDYLGDPETQRRVALAAAKLTERDGTGGEAIYHAIADRPEGLVHPSIWWGTSVENQAAARQRIPDLEGTPAAVRFLSCEPLLEGLDLREWIDRVDHCGRCTGAWEPQDEDICPDKSCATENSLISTWGREQRLAYEDDRRYETPQLDDGPRIHWIIAGCESGPGARECRSEWLRSLRDQAAQAGIAFFLKQASHPRDVLDRGELLDAPPGAPKEILYPGEKVHAIAAGPGSDVSNYRGFQGRALVELPYLDGIQHRTFPASTEEVASG